MNSENNLVAYLRLYKSVGQFVRHIEIFAKKLAKPHHCTAPAHPYGTDAVMFTVLFYHRDWRWHQDQRGNRIGAGIRIRIGISGNEVEIYMRIK